LAFVVVASSQECGMETRGTCSILACDPNRGATSCIGKWPWGKTCMCQVGYCATDDKERCVQEQVTTKNKAVVIVLDPIWDDSDAFANHVPLLREFHLIKVMIHRGKSFTFYKGQPPAKVFKRIEYDSDTPDVGGDKAAEQICPQLKKLGIPIEAVMPTSDPTVRLTDLLAACLGVRGNPATGPLMAARRDKWTMGESVRKAGLRSVGQTRVTTWSETEKFLTSWEPPLSDKRPCVFKIPNGVAGIGDYEVKSLTEAKRIFDLMGKTTYGGGSGNAEGRVDEFLIQEYLMGNEFAIDSVSRDGVHKVVAVWFEDFRPANGIFDQYFGFKLLDPAEDFTKKLIAYAEKSLDAIGLYNGAANTEVKWLEAEQQACLVETNARWAGINWNDGLGVEQAAVGNDQINAAFSAYLDGDAFEKMPAVLPLKKWGGMIFGINYQSGLLKAAPGFEAAKKYPSYYNGLFQKVLGQPIIPTTPDACPFTIGLVSDKKADVDADYARIVDLEKANKFFTVVPENLRLSAAQSSGHVGVVVFFAMLGLGAMALAIATVSRQEKRDGTEYLAVE